MPTNYLRFAPRTRSINILLSVFPRTFLVEWLKEQVVRIPNQVLCFPTLLYLLTIPETLRIFVLLINVCIDVRWVFRKLGFRWTAISFLLRNTFSWNFRPFYSGVDIYLSKSNWVLYCQCSEKFVRISLRLLTNLSGFPLTSLLTNLSGSINTFSNIYFIFHQSTYMFQLIFLIYNVLKYTIFTVDIT